MGGLLKARPTVVAPLPTLIQMEVEYLSHGVPLADYQLTKADHRRQQERVRAHEWVQRQVAKFPTSLSEESQERLRQLLGLPIRHGNCIGGGCACTADTSSRRPASRAARGPMKGSATKSAAQSAAWTQP